MWIGGWGGRVGGGGGEGFSPPFYVFFCFVFVVPSGVGKKLS